MVFYFIFYTYIINLVFLFFFPCNFQIWRFEVDPTIILGCKVDSFDDSTINEINNRLIYAQKQALMAKVLKHAVLPSDHEMQSVCFDIFYLCIC